MKKTVVLIVSLLCFLGNGFAQDVEWGIKGGMNVTALGSSSLGLQPRIGYNFGGTAEFIATPFISLQTELVYSLQGAALDQAQGIYLNYHYLNLPVFLKAYFYEDACFELGLQYGRLIKAVDETGYITSGQSEDVKKNDFSAVFGLSYKLNDRFTFGLRYNLGITNTGPQDVVYEQRYTNRVLQISLGYIF